MVEYHGSAVLLIFMLEAFFDSYDSVILNNSIPQVRVGYELAIIMSYPISASEIIVLLETPKKYGELVLSLIVKTTDFQLVFNFEQKRTVIIFGEHGIIMAHIPWWLSQSEL